MGIHFEIQYEENPHGMFFAGQIVRGLAVVTLDEPVPVKGVRIRVRGYAKVRWTESTRKTNSDGSTSSTSDIHYDEIQYFDSITECSKNKGLEYNLEPGVHTYSFECPLPAGCPSSFKGTYGQIHYETVVTLVRPWKFNKSFSLGFNVLNVVDLNHFPNLMIRASMEEFKTFCCGPCTSKPLVLFLDIPQTGYAPGEIIYVNAKVVNQSSTKVEQLRIALNLKALHIARHRVKRKIQKISLAKTKFSTDGKKIFEVKDVPIQVPPTPPTSEDLCEILKITYEVEVIAKVRGAHLPAVVSIPVTIGSIPLVARSVQISDDTLMANLRNGVTPDQQIGLDIELPPPSYEEAVYMQGFQATAPDKDDGDTDYGNYLPRYPVYSPQFPCLAIQDKN